jgi:hypothetical protein
MRLMGNLTVVGAFTNSSKYLWLENKNALNCSIQKQKGRRKKNAYKNAVQLQTEPITKL